MKITKSYLRTVIKEELANEGEGREENFELGGTLSVTLMDDILTNAAYIDGTVEIELPELINNHSLKQYLKDKLIFNRSRMT